MPPCAVDRSFVDNLVRSGGHGARRCRVGGGRWADARIRTSAVPLRPAARAAGACVVVGGGHVAQRRVPGLLAAGADVRRGLAAVTPAIEGLARPARSPGTRAASRTRTSTSAWYVIAATDDRAVNERGERGGGGAAGLLRARRRRHRAPRPGPRRSAGTPGVTVAVLGNRGARARSGGGARRDRRPGCATARSRRRDHARPRRPAWCWSAVGRATRSWSRWPARRALMEADVVVADRLAPRELLGELSGGRRARRRRQAAARPRRPRRRRSTG